MDALDTFHNAVDLRSSIRGDPQIRLYAKAETKCKLVPHTVMLKAVWLFAVICPDRVRIARLLDVSV